MIHSADELLKVARRRPIAVKPDDGEAIVEDARKRDVRSVIQKYGSRLPDVIHRRLRQKVCVNKPFSIKIKGKIYPGDKDDRSEIIWAIATAFRDAGADWEETAAVVMATPFWRDRIKDGKQESMQRLMTKVYSVGVPSALAVGESPSKQEDPFGSMAAVKEEAIRWLLKPYLARGAVTTLDGIPGQGKSTFVTPVIGKITTRDGTLPFGGELAHGRVLLFSAEDDPARILKRRLSANGANLSKIRYQIKPFTLDAKGIAMARAEMQEYRPILVVIDPLIAYLDRDSELNDAASMTRFMSELDNLAREFDCAILVIRHLRKTEADNALHRGLGSVAIAGRVRSVLVLGRHPDHPEMRAIAHAKCSWAKEGETILFEIDNSDETSVVRWCGTCSEITADDLIAGPPSKRGRQDNEREDARKFLLTLLADGEKPVSAIKRASDARPISWMTLRRAADDLQIVRPKGGRRSVWSLPSVSKASADR